MRFQVPQFIDVEDKVFGPFSFKQFLYLGGGVGICFVLLKLLPFWLAVIACLPVVILVLLLAFRNVNNRPFINIVEAFFRYMVGRRLYLWKQEQKPTQSANMQAQQYLRMHMPKTEGSKLKDLNWQIGVKKEEEDSEQ